MDYIAWASARATQATVLDATVPRLRGLVSESRSSLAGEGPVLLGIGASLAAAGPAVWHLRERGIDAVRLGAGDVPLPLPPGPRRVIAISQSGRSTETLAALDAVPAELRGAVVNRAPSPVADLVRHPITLGNLDDSYASTVGFTATLVSLGMIAEAWDGGSVDEEWAGIGRVAAGVEERLTRELRRAARFFRDAPSGDFVGQAPSAGLAEAGALLFREVARIPSSAMSTRQYLHGAMESAGTGVHVLLGEEREEAMSRTLTGAGHRVVLVTTLDAEPSELRAVLRIPDLPVLRRAVVEAVLMQALVEHVAAERGVDIEEFVFHNDDTKVASPQVQA